MTDIMSDWYDSDISSVIGMNQTYYQSLVWFRHNISHWYDAGILSVIGMIQTYHQLMTDNMSESYQWLILCLNHRNDWWYIWIIPITDNMFESYQCLIIMQVYYQSLAWFRHIISYWYDSDIISVIGMIQTYYQSLVWFRHIISHWLIVCLNHANDWYYVWIIPVTDSMSESYQWLILCLNHTNDW
jgi:hypothetical protein